MQPIGPLMIEHRLIERMIALIDGEGKRLLGGEPPNLGLLRVAVDFIRTYADQLHHGKEEQILFRDLARRKIAPEHAHIMRELIEEHAQGRKKVGRLQAAFARCEAGDRAAAQDLAEVLGELAAFYPAHILKEDKHFFIPCMTYFTPAEQAEMLAEFHEFDRTFPHLHYREIVAQLDHKKAGQII